MACNEERKKAFVVFASTYEAAVSHLTLEQMGELFMLMGRYSLAGEDVRSDNPMVDIILKMTIPNIEAAERRHQAAVENGSKGKEHGNKGGRPRNGETREEYDARRLERVRKNADGVENPEKPLNTDRNINTDKDIKNNTDSKKNTNIEVISNSISTNYLSSSNLKPSIDTARTCAKPGPETKPHQTLPDESNDENEETQHGTGRKQEERPRQGGNNGSKGSDFLRSITLEDEDDGVPPCPPDERYMNYVGTLQDILRYDAEPDYSRMTDADMIAAIKDTIDDAIECERREGTTQRYRDLIHRAKKIYQHLNGCDEDNAKRGITRLYREREKELR